MSVSNFSQDLLRYLRINGPTFSGELTAHFGISRATLSRRVQELGDGIASIGKGRATQLAAKHEELRSEVPIYQVQENGQLWLFGRLHALQGGGQVYWHLETEKAQSALLQDEFKNGIFPGWPWFLEDLRPAGFLGRAFARNVSGQLGISGDLNQWTDFELLKILTTYGFNLQGNFLLGNGQALDDYQSHVVRVREGLKDKYTLENYPDLAEWALDGDEKFGSSAGGEQPKFTIRLTEQSPDEFRAVIVKFSPKLDTEVGRRWADLLHAEQIANQILSEAGFAAAQTRVFEQENRAYLESERFDRVGTLGRRGLVSLRALDAAYVGMGSGSWADVAHRLYAGKWVTLEDRDRMIRLHCFGELIANSDMHWGNLSFFLPEASPFPLAPVYDMLPMHFRPSGSGEIVEREFKPRLPKPEDLDAWLEMYPYAIAFWRKVADSTSISDSFKVIAIAAIEALHRIHHIAVH